MPIGCSEGSCPAAFNSVANSGVTREGARECDRRHGRQDAVSAWVRPAVIRSRTSWPARCPADPGTTGRLTSRPSSRASASKNTAGACGQRLMSPCTRYGKEHARRAASQPPFVAAAVCSARVRPRGRRSGAGPMHSTDPRFRRECVGRLGCGRYCEPRLGQQCAGRAARARLGWCLRVRATHWCQRASDVGDCDRRRDLIAEALCIPIRTRSERES